MCLGWASPGSPAPGARLPALRTLSRLPPECVRRTRSLAMAEDGRKRRSRVSQLRRLWEESNISAVRGANAPSKDESEASAEPLAPPPTTSRRQTTPCNSKPKQSRLFLAAAGARAAPRPRAHRQAPQDGVPGHVSAPAHRLPRARPPRHSPTHLAPPAQRAGRHRRHRPIVALPLLWLRALLRLEPH